MTEPRDGSRDWVAPPAPYTVDYGGEQRTITREQWSPEDPTFARINLGAFNIPRSKGPWQQHYDRLAKDNALQAVTSVSSGRISAALWQQRAPTAELRNLWLLRMGWPRAQAPSWWEEAGGNNSDGTEFNPRAGGKAAQIDHIVELQLGGTNVPENLAPHTDTDNTASGREIWTGLRSAAQSAATEIAKRPGGNKLTSLALHFDSAKQSGAYDLGDPLPELPAPGASNRAEVLASRKGKAKTALRVHFTAEKDRENRTRPTEADMTVQAAMNSTLPEYPIRAATSAVLRVSETADKDQIENSTIPENHAARELISGMVLSQLHRPKGSGKTHTIDAWLDSPAHPAEGGRKKTRNPIKFDQGDKPIKLTVTDPKGTGKLQMPDKGTAVAFTYPYLSRGQMTLKLNDAGELSGHGTLTPSVPLLSKVPIIVDWDSTGLRGSIQPPVDKLSLPPFRITEAALTVSFAPELSAGGHIAFVIGSFAEGRITAGVDTRGLYATGDLAAKIPGLDAAGGHVEYRPSTGLTGWAEARASKGTGVIRSGLLRVDLAQGNWSVQGEVSAMLPGDSPAVLSAKRVGDKVVYSGRATLNVPGLHPVEVTDLSYDGTQVSGSARTTFSVLGATGTLVLGYRDGKFTGRGDAELKRGKFTGKLGAELHPTGALTGTGSGQIEFKPGLVGAVRLEYGADRRLKTTGEIRFPPYTFLQPHSNRRQIFQRSLPDIPLFAIPLGVGAVGLVGRIGGGLAVRYGYGPGVLRDMVIRATMYPLEPDHQLEAAAEATLDLPAEAGIELSVRAGIGASVAFASATGGITVVGGVLLRGGMSAKATLSYARDVLILDAAAKISATPILTLRVDADIVIEAVTGGSWRWPYNLAAYSLPLGGEFGLIAPFSYRSDQPLRLPAVSDIRWIVPDIDVTALATQVGNRVRAAISS
ncbi:hypothetical protein MINS_31720 [Mycolicibacterium insubricum]|uniref:Uncharacterized protein n=1 Tax=Mycolicibacterium insubricum TaxID=444597 RepID=A0A1X0D4S0_9MYCO|nr:hypothetical protein [Mycolicibacterium insubricum]MCB9441280.1 hypothetical protein [Mycolicibacterium sp.]MCV7083840.1 hypothetical protein [Mycolicibacterium insubricum]ORA67404.1 hypothetical protein BST26_15840 [Mycolicibacterium insubricum]BBZ67743.1 hypothetical protein MINS_31720 [Mycolicibacterium insubricum]